MRNIHFTEPRTKNKPIIYFTHNTHTQPNIHEHGRKIPTAVLRILFLHSALNFFVSHLLYVNSNLRSCTENRRKYNLQYTVSVTRVITMTYTLDYSSVSFFVPNTTGIGNVFVTNKKSNTHVSPTSSVYSKINPIISS